ncbi:hypothetical protein FIBSPDRAFT_867966 [Athelia psychrophila]|uniref:Uncharacterized protein n=1 Tax=Athelia psychrophila TaxID=1759441 RepID=A0A166DL33_9AGAM|nr:hypothetical protein FIBSPDRAFT_867966 [Fibularhizoctonia sp. CBS 109695]
MIDKSAAERPSIHLLIMQIATHSFPLHGHASASLMRQAIAILDCANQMRGHLGSIQTHFKRDTDTDSDTQR